jgi:hypothetical protein
MTVDDVDDEFAARFAQQFADVWQVPDLDRGRAGKCSRGCSSWPLTADVHSFGHVDRFTFTDGLIAERVSFFDAVPLVMTLLRRPRGWTRLRRLAH